MFSNLLNNTSEVRRQFLDSLLWCFSIISFFGIAYPVGMFLWPKRIETKGAGKRTMKFPAAEFPIGGVKFIRFLKRPAVVLRPNEQSLIALSAICTHLGCVVKWNEAAGELVCPCHGGRFDIKGNVLGGPPPSPLVAFKATIVNEYIIIEEA